MKLFSESAALIGKEQKRTPGDYRGMSRSEIDYVGELLGEILQSLQRTDLDDLAGGLGREHLLHLGEWIDALVGFGGGLLDDHDLQQARHDESTWSIHADQAGDPRYLDNTYNSLRDRQHWRALYYLR